ESRVRNIEPQEAFAPSSRESYMTGLASQAVGTAGPLCDSAFLEWMTMLVNCRAVAGHWKNNCDPARQLPCQSFRTSLVVWCMWTASCGKRQQFRTLLAPFGDSMTGSEK